MKKNVLLAVIIFFVSLSYSGLTAQTKQSIGKIFDKDLGNVVFGKVHLSFPMGKDVIKKIMDDTTDIVMFKITKKGFGVFNKYRNTIHPDNAQVAKDEPCYLFSKDKIKEFLERSKDSSNVSVEMRGSTLTLSSDEFIIDQSWYCPPVCP